MVTALFLAFLLVAIPQIDGIEPLGDESLDQPQNEIRVWVTRAEEPDTFLVIGRRNGAVIARVVAFDANGVLETMLIPAEERSRIVHRLIEHDAWGMASSPSGTGDGVAVSVIIERRRQGNYSVAFHDDPVGGAPCEIVRLLDELTARLGVNVEGSCSSRL